MIHRIFDHAAVAALAVVLAVTVLTGRGAAAPIIIDDFSGSESGVSVNSTQSTTGLGGEREVVFDNGLSGLWTVSGGFGSLTGVGSAGELELNYDGVLGGDSETANVFALGSVDLTMGGLNDRFELDVDAVTGSMTALIRVFTDSGANFLNYPFEITAPGTYSLLFTDIGGSVGSPSLTNVDSVYLWIGTVATSLSDDSIGGNESISLDLFQATGPAAAVPEPGTSALLGAGLLALVAWRRRVG